MQLNKLVKGDKVKMVDFENGCVLSLRTSLHTCIGYVLSNIASYWEDCRTPIMSSVSVIKLISIFKNYHTAYNFAERNSYERRPNYFYTFCECRGGGRGREEGRAILSNVAYPTLLLNSRVQSWSGQSVLVGFVTLLLQS